METTTVYRVYMGIMENQMETTIMGYIPSFPMITPIIVHYTINPLYNHLFRTLDYGSHNPWFPPFGTITVIEDNAKILWLKDLPPPSPLPHFLPNF